MRRIDVRTMKCSHLGSVLILENIRILGCSLFGCTDIAPVNSMGHLCWCLHLEGVHVLQVLLTWGCWNVFGPGPSDPFPSGAQAWSNSFEYYLPE